uniref:Uncharacterized protein n=1 Tax=Anopheles atroparvus TaxID=41427 RepID=A0A182IX35_ANOAO
MKRRVTIVYNPVQPVQQQHGRRTGHGSRWDHSPSVPSPAAYTANIIPSPLASPSSSSSSSFSSQNMISSLCLSCMASSPSSSSSRSSSSSLKLSSSTSPSSTTPPPVSSFSCQRCCSISSILKSSSSSSSSSLSASEKAAQIEDALNNNHHHHHHHHQHQQQHNHHPKLQHQQPSEACGGAGCCAGSTECSRHPARQPGTKGGSAGVQPGPLGNVTGLPAPVSPRTAERHDWCRYLLVGLIAALCYLNGIQGDFVHDDIPAITLNKDVLGLSPMAQVFRNDFWGTPMADLSSHKSYRPLTTLTFRVGLDSKGLLTATVTSHLMGDVGKPVVTHSMTAKTDLFPAVLTCGRCSLPEAVIRVGKLKHRRATQS